MAWKDRAGNYARSRYEESKGRGYGTSRFGRHKYDESGKLIRRSRWPRVVGNAGRAAGNTSLAITGSWDHMSWKVRALIAFVLTFAILFVPFGIFQYVGWALYLAVTWIVNSFYWFVASIANTILNVFISSIDTIFQFVTEKVGGTYHPLESWTLTTGSLLDPDVFKPETFDTRYLLQWIWENFGGTIQGMFDYIRG